MALIDHNNNKELATIEFRKSKMNALIPRTTLASIESLTMPLVSPLSIRNFAILVFLYPLFGLMRVVYGE